MKTTLNSLLITAAGFALSAAAAYGQTTLTAHVPFSFRTPGGVQPAGEYRVAPISTDGSVSKIENVETRKAAMTGMGSPNGNPNDKTAALVFRCGDESGCALVGVKMGDGRGWEYNAPKLKASENARTAVVYLESKSAE